MSQQQEPGAGPRFTGSVAATFPLALLEAVRAHDRPGEILEDEDLTVSLPRRLGLTGVVETQIRRYEDAQRTGRRVPMGEVVSLIRLVLRRPDAEPILRETGQRLARWHFRRTPELWQRLLHKGPRRLALRSARRASVRALRALQAGSSVEGARPLRITIHDCALARLGEDGNGCTLVSALIEEHALLYTGAPHRVSHAECSSAGADTCVWE